MLTAARARESKAIRSNSIRGKDRLDGIIPVVEDWHAKLCFLEVKHISLHNIIVVVATNIIWCHHHYYCCVVLFYS